MIVCELSVVPVGTKTASVSRYVVKAVNALEKEGFIAKNRAMATEFEAKNIEEACRGMQAVHKAVLEEGAMRLVTFLKVDERRDKEQNLNGKIKSVNEKK